MPETWEPEQQLFTRQQRCGSCDGPLNPGDNWGCARAWVPINGLPLSVELHQHVHIGCVDGYVRILALGNLLRQRVGLN